MQGSLTASIALLLLSVTAEAAAVERPCVARASLHVDVAPTPFDPPLAKSLFAQLFHELDEPDAGGPCLPSGAASSGGGGSSANVSVTWPDDNHAEVTVEIREPHARRSVVRTVDLTGVPADGRSLAVTIAATELFDELRAQLEAVRPLVPAAPKAAAHAKPSVAPVRREFLGGFGPSVAVDAFTRGVVLVGSDARLTIALSSKVQSGIRFGVRAPIDSREQSPSGASYVFGAEIAASPWDLSRAWGLQAKVRIDALSMPKPTGDRATLVVPAIGPAVWISATARTRASAELFIGAPLSSSPSAHARGLVLGGGVALAVSF